MKWLAMPTLEMKTFSPSSTQPVPSRLAVARIDATSLPASGSVRAKAPMRSPRTTSWRNSARRGAAGDRTNAWEPSPCTANTASARGETYPSRSRAMQSARTDTVAPPIALPPSFGGTSRRKSPSCARRVPTVAASRSDSSRPVTLSSSSAPSALCSSPKKNGRSDQDPGREAIASSPGTPGPLTGPPDRR